MFGAQPVARVITVGRDWLDKYFPVKASVTDPHRFGAACQFAASLGLTPKADSSGGGGGTLLCPGARALAVAS